MSARDPHEPEAEHLITVRQILPYLSIAFGSAFPLPLLA